MASFKVFPEPITSGRDKCLQIGRQYIVTPSGMPEGKNVWFSTIKTDRVSIVRSSTFQDNTEFGVITFKGDSIEISVEGGSEKESVTYKLVAAD